MLHRALPQPGSAAPARRQASRCRPPRQAIIVAHGRDYDSPNTVKLFSPSKINLFLRVTRRREDGYHDLASLFHAIDLGDEMEFTASPYTLQDNLVCSDPTIPSDERNLVIKALNLYRRKTFQTMYFDVKLNKKVPHGAGLGGGSGNAATALFAANKLMGSPASDEEMMEWAGEIGSDISVFFAKGAAYCTGRGEVVEDVAPPVPLDTPILLGLFISPARLITRKPNSWYTHSGLWTEKQ
ncbi:4-diphosphocytidyl-2-C-methyl-D-erythritol kinase, chloroplastic/chromoplastic [Tetrabaena socialis]|uniref:4-diphosphocytidyl-2-C-methyl-D-erythritol kinase, chloroplastic/chromoplastic n=1 Tax=Tetrabaena socialis TaxID=47790 RepID=A0A2J8AI40_9CHLO|nr:4-diphosphocytidyl-2-C-methyl-D-erythritol kinase, chloroplastic/chromoplastic [Tetrabaena socialis]|eukprot:PNH12188.1 4-diphosphocytidyl-2-C-methyl-D-erythritol kinase, chloroplastic/chromoplastic [Tetrabaena socialis]